MSILIKDMEMPTNCAECRLCEGDTMDGLCHAVSKWFDDEYFRWYQYEEDDIDGSKPANCPLVEVPTPHGRLTDADVLYKVMLKEKNRIAENYGENDEYVLCLVKYAMSMVENAPTIIEAEGVEL